jgi:hypothetical protein
MSESGQDLFLELRDKQQQLETALGELGKRGKARANAEKIYRQALRKEILIERDKGTPVTIVSDICRGSRKISELRFERDVADVVYSSAKDAIQIYKLVMKILNEQIGREWNRS